MKKPKKDITPNSQDSQPIERGAISVDSLGNCVFEMFSESIHRLPNIFSLIKSRYPEEKELIRRMQDAIVVAAAWLTSSEDSKIKEEIAQMAKDLMILGTRKKLNNTYLKNQKITDQDHQAKNQQLDSQIEDLQNKLVQMTKSQVELNCQVSAAEVLEQALVIFQKQATARQLSPELINALD